ncbi:KCH1 Low affinity K(+) transporter 1 [Candida maltosa Xu316]|uniref:Vacuolar membrane protein n=1 Tax=Candida maltosa (strain Xu316) TaxID=1245528 RepID=M3IMT4_CANMX|nr:hypothetical protein G210_1912 [Candida maltosa Xu316]
MANNKSKRHSRIPAGNFNAEKEIQKYHLDVSTFDVIDVNNFRNYKFSTLFWYIYMWTLVFLSFALLATDIYSCLNILVFHKWATDNYKPYAYSIAKWIFTGCIIFQFVLLFYHWLWAIHILRTKNIALVYLNSIAKKVYSIRNYNYFCLLNNINEGNFFDWCCFLTYYELDNALQILIADTPRQVINVLTLRFYATGGELNNNILQNIEAIAQTNLYLSVILSFMCLSVFIYAIFLFRFLFGMLCYIPLKVQLKKQDYHSFKDYCCYLINEHVSKAVTLHHKPKTELLEQGILPRERIADLPGLPDKKYRDNDYSKTFYNASERNVTNDSIIPLDNMKSNRDYRREYVNHKEEKVYSPINDQTNNIGRRLSQLRDKYSHPQPPPPPLPPREDSYASQDSTIENVFADTYGATNKPRQQSQSSLLYEPAQPRSNSLPFENITSQPLNQFPQRAFTDDLDYSAYQQIPDYKTRRKPPSPVHEPTLFENDDDSSIFNDFIEPLPKTYTQEYQKMRHDSYPEPSADFITSSVSEFSQPSDSHDYADLTQTDGNLPVPTLKKASTEPLVSITHSSDEELLGDKLMMKRSRTEEYPMHIEEEDEEDITQPLTDKLTTEEHKPEVVYPEEDPIDNLLDDFSFSEHSKEAPYPVRGVSKYFER